ncbi:MAG: nucleotidyltransferase domain-containing protein, partial [Candidatus Yonathbacteria bacterium]|nr:nucleotidyltransferase domain-containing protein [Candidatus Yonathbacteria bacterium]
MTTQILIKQIIPVLESQKVLKASIFGSFARGDNTKNSDIDILVKLKNGKTLFDLIELKMLLEEKLDRKVDVLT